MSKAGKTNKSKQTPSSPYSTMSNEDLVREFRTSCFQPCVDFAKLDDMQKEILSRMIPDNAEQFTLYGVKNDSTGKLVSDLTNPRHKYWERKNNPREAIQRDRWRAVKYGDAKLIPVEIKCFVKGPIEY